MLTALACTEQQHAHKKLEEDKQLWDVHQKSLADFISSNVSHLNI